MQANGPAPLNPLKDIAMTTVTAIDTQQSLSQNPALQRMQRTLHLNLTRVWPTRRQPLCPSAYAGLVNAADLDLKVSPPLQGKALTVFLPSDFEPHLRSLLSESCPQVVVHPDISLARQAAYLSWSAPSVAGKLPLTLWVELSSLIDALAANEVETGTMSLPLVLVAGDSVAAADVAPGDDVNSACVEALIACEKPPAGVTAEQQAKAAIKLEFYGERPWLFMRYELKAGQRRLAVNWAPVMRLHAAGNASRP